MGCMQFYSTLCCIAVIASIVSYITAVPTPPHLQKHQQQSQHYLDILGAYIEALAQREKRAGRPIPASYFRYPSATIINKPEYELTQQQPSSPEPLSTPRIPLQLQKDNLSWGAQHAVEFTHISKTGGTSLFKELYALERALNNSGELGRMEKCFDAYKIPIARTMLMVRSPAAHVYSQFAECRDSQWGKRTTEGTQFPRSNAASASASASASAGAGAGATVSGSRGVVADQTAMRSGLEARTGAGHEAGKEADAKGENIRRDYLLFLRHFAQLTDNMVGSNFDFNCYDPRNFITRFLSCGVEERPHHAEISPPKLQRALLNINLAHFVGVTDLYIESVCLLEVRVTGHLSDRCACDQRRPEQFYAIDHGVTHLDHDTVLMQPKLQTKVERLTILDRVVFGSGLLRLLCDAREVEQQLLLLSGRLNRSDNNYRIVCPRRMDQLSKKLNYLNLF